MHETGRLILQWFTLVIAVAPLVANAGSFNCDRAATEVEKLICSDTELSTLDDQLAAEYKSALARSGNIKNLILRQRNWLAQRNACRSRECLLEAYSSRVASLQAIPAEDEVNCDPSVGAVDIEHCPPDTPKVTQEQLRTRYCMRGPSGDYIKKGFCNAEENDYVLARTRVARGDQAFCRELLTAEYTLLDLNLPHSVSEEDATAYLDLRGAKTEIYPLAGHFDINNDGRPENIAWLKAYSGAGSGCDIERFVQLDSRKARIVNSKLTALLGVADCSTYYRAFRYQGRSYLENRRITRLPSYAYVDLVREVIALDGNKRSVVCRYAYNHK